MKQPWNDGWAFSADPASGRWAEVRLPHTTVELPYNEFSEEVYQRATQYRKTFRPDPARRGQRAWITFEAAMVRADVWLNGRRVGSHVGGYTAFRLDVTEALDWSQDNVLTVDVDSREDPEIPPFGNVVDYLTYGGLYREVTWEWVPRVGVGDLHLRPETGGVPHVAADVTLANPLGDRGPARLSWTVTSPSGPEVTGSLDVTLDGSPEPVVTVRQPVPGAAWWDLESPALHTFTLRLETASGPHSVDDRFGFRTAEFRAGGFYLNGRRVELRGLNRHQSFPYVGSAMPRSAQRRDAEILKRELGVNLVRSSHYPPSRHFLDRCDELGLLVFVELPGWQHIGGDVWKDRAVASVGEMVRQGRNHPSVVLWGVRINESADDDAFYLRTNALAKSLDPDRATGGVRDFAGSQLLEDVYTFNDFSHDRGGPVLQKPRSVARARVPYLVTEFNGHMFPTKRFDPEARRTEHALRHLRVLDAAAGDPGVAGALGWCFADYNTHKDFGSGDRICYHGVLDLFRIPKVAAGAYASQSDAWPYLEVTSFLTPGDHDRADLPAVVVLTNADCVEVRRNGEAIGRFFPDRRAFPHLPHPPVLVDDFIGNRIETHEAFSPRDAARIKRVLLAVVKRGVARLPLNLLLTMGWLLFKYRLTYTQGADLFRKYVANWGQKQQEWEFVGYRDGREVARVRTGPHDQTRLEVTPDALELVEGDTWDTVRVVVAHRDEYGRTLPYSSEVVTVLVSGPAEVIGPSTFALLGGARAFWLKSTGVTGTVTVTVSSARWEDQSFALEVRR